MIIAGIVGNYGTGQTASLINSILSSKGKKVSSVDFKNLAELGSTQIKLYLNELDKNGVDVLLLKIKLSDDEKQLGQIHLDAVIYPDKPSDASSNNDYSSLQAQKIFSLLDEKGVVIANEDDPELISFLEGSHRPVITYGFNSKASITTSSVGDMVSDSGLMFCLQKPIPAKDGFLVGPHEYRINVGTGEFDTHNLLAAATFAIINGVEP